MVEGNEKNTNDSDSRGNATSIDMLSDVGVIVGPANQRPPRSPTSR